MTTATQRAIDWTEQGYIPDVVIRKSIRRLLKQRLLEIADKDCEEIYKNKSVFIEKMRNAPVALLPEKANEQHYEVPDSFYEKVLGQHKKYSCCYWDENTRTLDQAEVNALVLTCQHAKLVNGQRILELGCGWGSLTLWMANYFPGSQITAVSNSNSQREYILQQARSRNLNNIRVITCDMNDFKIDDKFDRIVSVEMFEHMRNWPLLFARIHNWLMPDGKFFMHVFCHRDAVYEFTDKNDDDWMSRHFFSGGIMPSDDLALHFQKDLRLAQQWRWNGEHYQKTAEAWLHNMDNKRDVIWSILQTTYPAQDTQKWWMRWRMFFMACAELFGYEHGQQWWVSHYLFENRS